jgi:uncharacterized protein YkwD
VSKFKKLLLYLIVTGIFLGVCAVPVWATNDIKVIVNGNTLSLDVAPAIENNRILLPMRAISEAMGATVNYIPETKQVDIYRGSDRMHIYLNRADALVNGSVVTMDVAARAVKGRTLLPLRFVGESLGATVNWNNTTKTVNIVAQGSSSNGGNNNSNNNSALEISAMEKELLNLLNQERSQKGLNKYLTDSNLAKMAKAHSMDMAENDFFSHISPTYGSAQERAKIYGISNVGENIAYGYPSAQSAFDAFMNSPSHRANMLSSSYTHVGIGIDKKSGTTNTDIYVTIDFY